MTHTTKEGWEERFDKAFDADKHWQGDEWVTEKVKAFIASEIQKAQVEVLDELYKAYKFADEDIEAGAMLHAMKQIRARITNKQSEI